MTVSETRTWWKDGTVYQIWPASYKDSNGDGVGDIVGIISTLDYLKDLGVDIIWVSPIYDSPQKDMGYDISNYEEIYPPYGTVAEADKLIEECHNRGIRIIFDLVVNHTSDQHAWFKESRSSKSNPKRDWYIWRPAKYDKDGTRRPPNNWRAHFGGSAWEWDEQTQEYYLHLFVPEQPDLNWDNEATRQAIFDSAVNFWLKKGVDGFRVDTVNMYSKPSDYPDAAITDQGQEFQFAPNLFCNGPRMYEFLREMNSQCFSHYDCFCVGELSHTPDPAHVLRYVSAKEKQLDMVFQFDLVDLGQGPTCRYETSPVELPVFKNLLARMQALTAGNDGWSTAFLENHDQARSISRFADDSPKWRVRSGKMLAILLSTLTGTLFLYQGQEIGMINIPGDWPDHEYKDIESINYATRMRKVSNDDPTVMAKAVKGMSQVARDNARTPVQWDASPHAGFTTGEKPWMRANDSYHEINVAAQQKDPKSVLAFWKSMLQLRKQFVDVFVHGTFEMFDASGDKTIVYGKTFGKNRVLVHLNFSSERQRVEVPWTWEGGKLLVSNVDEEEREKEWLAGWEGRIYDVSE